MQPLIHALGIARHVDAVIIGDLIKKETGITAQEYIKSRLIGHAKELILGTEKTVNQISMELGFQYPQHFNRIFKKATGLTPSEYRKTTV